jgi:multidrug efflux pump
MISISKEGSPDSSAPEFHVSIAQQGASPEDMERLFILPVESALRDLDGVKQINATATNGNARITVKFDNMDDKKTALADIRHMVNTARSELSAGAEKPVMMTVEVTQ